MWGNLIDQAVDGGALPRQQQGDCDRMPPDPHTVLAFLARASTKKFLGLEQVVSTASLESSIDVAVPAVTVSTDLELQSVEIEHLQESLSEEVLPQEALGSAVTLQALRGLLDGIAALKPQSLEQLLPGLRILGLAVVAGVGLKMTAAVLGSIDELPLLGRLLELVGLITAIQFISRHALQQQKRAALLARIEQLRANLLG